jgi:trimeric autotransporter adhesin
VILFNLPLPAQMYLNLKKEKIAHFMQKNLQNVIKIFTLAVMLLGVNASWGQASIAAGSTNYTQNFNTLTSGTWTDGTTLTGWYAKTDASSVSSYIANTGSTLVASLSAFGVAGTNPLTDRALGHVPTNTYFGSAGTAKGYVGWRLKNNTGSAITSLTITYTGEQWRRDNAAAQTLTVEYQTGTTVTNLNSGSWTSVSALTFTSPTLGSTALALDGNASANRVANISATVTVSIPAGEEIMIRWSDLNDSGNDHFLSIDDVTVNATTGTSNAAPTATSVANTGTLTVGQLLTGTYTYGDAESDPQGTSTFQWYRADNAAGTTNKTAISGATTSTYTLVTADAGKYISFAVVPKASSGTATGTETYSTYRGPVVANNPVLAITGTANVGTACVNSTVTSSTFTITNTGGVAATLASVGSSNGEFVVNALSSTTIAANGGTATFTVTLTPTAGGTRNATLTPASTTSGTTVTTYNINGTGTAAAAPTVSTIAATGVTGYAATIQGTATVTACSGPVAGYPYGVEYSLTSFTGGAGTAVAASNINGSGVFTVTINGLSPLTTYYYRTFAQNATGKIYSSQLSFQTACGTFSLPFTENFEGTTFPPSCWTSFRGANDLGTTNDWTRVVSNTYNGSAGTASVIYENVTNGQVSQDWLVTPALAIPASQGFPYKLRFFESQDYTTDYGTTYSIKVSTTSQTSIASFTDVVTYGESTFGIEYTERVIDLSAYAGQTIYVAFVHSQDDGDSWFIDNVRVKQDIDAPVATAATNVSTSGFTANWNSVANANSYRLDVATIPFTTTLDDLVYWDFPNNPDNNVADGGTISSNLSKTITTNVTGVSYPQVAGSTTASASASGWDNGIGTKYWQIEFATTGYQDIKVSSVQRSSNSGPRDFKLQYKVGSGTYTDLAGVTITTANNWTTGSIFEIPLPAACNNQTSVSVRWVVASDVRVDNSTGVASTGVSGIDNIYISGALGSYVQPYQDYTVSSTSQVLSGLSQNTTYYYRVRAVNNANSYTSGNSNIINVTTGKELIWTTGNEWTYGGTPLANGVNPTTADDGTIAAGATYTPPATTGLAIGNLTVNATATVDIPSNHTITIARNLVNNAPAANFTVQDNGALVQTATGAATNTTPITVYKYSNPLYRLDYTLWSAPTVGQTLRQFSLGTSNNRFYEYVSSATADEGYYPVEPLTTSFDASNRGKSWLIRMPNTITADGTGTTNNLVTTPAEYAAGTDNYYFHGTFVGTPNTGDIAYSLNTAGGRYNAVGNPYASPINIASFFTTNSTTLDSGTLYFWRKRNSTTGTGSYATLTLADYLPNSTGDNETNATGGQNNDQYYVNGNSANWTIAPGQGFLVKAATTATALTFNNAMRKPAPTGTLGQAFLKTGISQVSRFRMRVTTPEGDASQMSVVYMPQGTLGLDYGYDGKLLGDAALSLYTLAENALLSIQARPEFDVTDVVPAGFKASTAGTYTIALSYTDGVFANGQKIYLKDKAEGVIREMGTGDYTFTSEAGTFEDRFEVVYATTALGTDTPVLNANTVIVYQNGGTININSGAAVMNSINVFDIRGRKLYTAEKVNATEAAINNLTAAQQVLIVEITTDKGTVTKKIVF